MLFFPYCYNLKIPEKTPNLDTIRVQLTQELIGNLGPVLRKANTEYLCWDDYKSIAMPAGIAPEQAWAVLKMYRSLQVRSLPLIDPKGNAFTYWLPDCVLKDINFIDRHVGGSILVHDPSVPSEERRRCMVRSLVDEAISSSQIEGAATSRAAAKEMLRTGRRPRDRSERMIFNNYEALQMIKGHLQEPLTTDLILALHARMTRDTLEDTAWEGRFRTTVDRAMHVLDSDDQTVLYEPPDALGIAGSMRGLCEFANSDNRDEFVNPVIKGILLHFWLAYVHPFMDGNGPIARALFYWYLLKHRYWGFEYLSVSTAILSDRMQYYRSFLHTERDGNDATYFIVYNLKEIRRAIETLDEYIREKQKEKKQTYRLSAKYSSVNPRQRMLLASAFEKPNELYAIETHANVHAVTYQTARTDLLGLESMGLLKMKKDGKKFVFTPVRDLKEKLEE